MIKNRWLLSLALVAVLLLTALQPSVFASSSASSSAVSDEPLPVSKSSISMSASESTTESEFIISPPCCIPPCTCWPLWDCLNLVACCPTLLRCFNLISPGPCSLFSVFNLINVCCSPALLGICNFANCIGPIISCGGWIDVLTGLNICNPCCPVLIAPFCNLDIALAVPFVEIGLSVIAIILSSVLALVWGVIEVILSQFYVGLICAWPGTLVCGCSWLASLFEGVICLPCTICFCPEWLSVSYFFLVATLAFFAGILPAVLSLISGFIALILGIIAFILVGLAEILISGPIAAIRHGCCMGVSSIFFTVLLILVGSIGFIILAILAIIILAIIFFLLVVGLIIYLVLEIVVFVIGSLGMLVIELILGLIENIFLCVLPFCNPCLAFCCNCYQLFSIIPMWVISAASAVCGIVTGITGIICWVIGLPCIGCPSLWFAVLSAFWWVFHGIWGVINFLQGLVYSPLTLVSLPLSLPSCFMVSPVWLFWLGIVLIGIIELIAGGLSIGSWIGIALSVLIMLASLVLFFITLVFLIIIVLIFSVVAMPLAGILGIPFVLAIPFGWIPIIGSILILGGAAYLVVLVSYLVFTILSVIISIFVMAVSLLNIGIAIATILSTVFHLMASYSFIVVDAIIQVILIVASIIWILFACQTCATLPASCAFPPMIPCLCLSLSCNTGITGLLGLFGLVGGTGWFGICGLYGIFGIIGLLGLFGLVGLIGLFGLAGLLGFLAIPISAGIAIVAGFVGGIPVATAAVGLSFCMSLSTIICPFIGIPILLLLLPFIGIPVLLLLVLFPFIGIPVLLLLVLGLLVGIPVLIILALIPIVGIPVAVVVLQIICIVASSLLNFVAGFLPPPFAEGLQWIAGLAIGVSATISSLYQLGQNTFTMVLGGTGPLVGVCSGILDVLHCGAGAGAVGGFSLSGILDALHCTALTGFVPSGLWDLLQCIMIECDISALDIGLYFTWDMLYTVCWTLIYSCCTGMIPRESETERWF